MEFLACLYPHVLLIEPCDFRRIPSTIQALLELTADIVEKDKGVYVRLSYSELSWTMIEDQFEFLRSRRIAHSYIFTPELQPWTISL